jgi:outer membrane protein
MRLRSAAFVLLLAAALGPAATAAAQTPLTLADAVARARAHNPDAGSSAAAEREAAQRVIQARAGYWPTVDLVESWQRGTQPVFVFSSLLAQRQFTAADFALDALNHPAALDNFRSALTVEQPLIDAGTKAHVTAARIGRAAAAASRQVVDQDLAIRVTDAFGQVLVASGARRSADAAVATALADRELAANRRDAGRSTDADVLQIDLHVSRSRERQIRATSAERIARARLNEAMGEPLGEVFVLAPSSAAAVADTGDVGALEAMALGNRPEVALAALHEDLARAGESAARAAFLPRVSLQGGW